MPAVGLRLAVLVLTFVVVFAVLNFLTFEAVFPIAGSRYSMLCLDTLAVRTGVGVMINFAVMLTVFVRISMEWIFKCHMSY